MPELNNKIEMNCMKKINNTQNKEEKLEEKSNCKTTNTNNNPKSPVNRVKIAPNAFAEVRIFYILTILTPQLQK